MLLYGAGCIRWISIRFDFAYMLKQVNRMVPLHPIKKECENSEEHCRCLKRVKTKLNLLMCKNCILFRKDSEEKNASMPPSPSPAVKLRQAVKEVRIWDNTLCTLSFMVT